MPFFCFGFQCLLHKTLYYGFGVEIKFEKGLTPEITDKIAQYLIDEGFTNNIGKIKVFIWGLPKGVDVFSEKLTNKL